MYTNDAVHRGKLTVLSGAAIAAGLCVIATAAGTVTKPTDGSNPFGVALSTASTANESVEVQPFALDEEVRLTASAAIAAGDYVEIITSGISAGKIRTLTSGTGLFKAVEAATADGDFILCRPVPVPEVAQPAPVALNATGEITLAALQSGIITSTTASAVTGTTVAGSVLDDGGKPIRGFYKFSVINTGGSNAFTVAGGTGVTVVGLATVAANTSGRFIIVRTADDTWIIYRL